LSVTTRESVTLFVFISDITLEYTMNMPSKFWLILTNVLMCKFVYDVNEIEKFETELFCSVGFGV